MTNDAPFTEDTMCDCLELTVDPLPEPVIDEQAPASAIDLLPEYPLPVNPFEDLEDLVRNNHQPDVPVTMLDPNAPSLASIDNQLDASTSNTMLFNEGYTAQLDDSGTVAWFAPGDLTPSF